MKMFDSREEAVSALKPFGLEAKAGAHVEEREGKFHLVNLPEPAKGNPAVDSKKPTPKKEKKMKTPKKAVKAKKSAKPSKKAAKAKSTKAPKEARVTVASRIRELIKSGKDNQQVWDVVQKEFKLDDSKRHYPSWYRSQLKRK